MLITFEGCEATGKSTQASILKDYLIQQGHDTVLTNEPGGSELANILRSIILEKEISDVMTEFLLIVTARRDHIIKTIKPALQAKKYVICDRFIDSTIVYQGYAKGLNKSFISSTHSAIIEGLVPDLTFVMDASFGTISSRIKKSQKHLTFYDLKTKDFHMLIKSAFLDIAKKDKIGRFYTINADTSINEVASNIQRIIKTISDKNLL